MPGLVSTTSTGALRAAVQAPYPEPLSLAATPKHEGCWRFAPQCCAWQSVCWRRRARRQIWHIRRALQPSPLNGANFCSRLTVGQQRLAATRTQAQRECAATLQRARPEAGSAVCPPGGFAVAPCGILWLSSPISPCAVSQATPMHPLLRRQALPVVQQTAANHSIEPTATGVPASAAHVKR